MKNNIARAAFIVILCAPVLTQAAPLRTNDFADWLQGLEQEAVASGIGPETVESALDGVVPDDRVIELDQKQPEATITFDAYIHHTVTPERIREGRQLLEKYADVLDAIAGRYGVAPQIVVALWGIESSYGHNSGDFNIVTSLVTLAYESRRGDFFRGELLDALRIVDRAHIAPSSLRGSWAGAMGQCQFMPSTYLRHAVSYDNGGGAPDIWDNTPDVLASIANYLASEGWSNKLTWGREIEIDDEIPDQEIGLDRRRLLAEWAKMGVTSLGGDDLPNRPLQASLIQPDGPHGRSFLVYDNFRALLKWNRSTYFASAVGLLADRIK